jgi:gliding motility-associated-like protein
VGNSIAVDVEGNSYITGSFTTVSIAEEKRPTFGDFSLSSCGLDDIFICQYNKDGNVVKVAKAGGNWSDIGLGIAINQAGCCFVTGYFKSFTALFGSLPVMATGQANVFVTKLDHAQWQYASVNISAKSNQYCRQNSFPVDFTLTCTSFPFNPEVSIEISEVNSSVFPSSPIIIGKGDTSPVQCQFPAYMPAGKYTLRAKVLGLAQTNIAEVILQEQNNSLSIQMGSTQVCADHEVTFTAIPLVEGNKPVYTWRLNGVTQNSSSRTLSLKIPLTDIEQLMKIEVEMSSPGNCNLYAQQTLNVLPLPGLSCSLPEEIVANTKAAFTASASGGQPPYTYFWDFGDEQTLQGDHNPEVTHTYIHNGSYRVVTTVTDNKGCTSKCINTIQVQLNLDSLPNVFTPNGDFVNDRFTMNYNGREPFEMLIYNRWGKLVAQTISGLEGWDGMGCATGVYYYSIRVGSRKRKGWIQLLR